MFPLCPACLLQEHATSAAVSKTNFKGSISSVFVPYLRWLPDWVGRQVMGSWMGWHEGLCCSYTHARVYCMNSKPDWQYLNSPSILALTCPPPLPAPAPVYACLFPYPCLQRVPGAG